MATTPESIIPNAPDYKNRAWEEYTVAELGNIIHFFVKRAGHRQDPVKAAKDLKEARAYRDMLNAKIDEAEQKFVTFKVN